MTAVAVAGSRPLLGNAPLTLDEGTTPWRVISGRAQVFALLRVADADADGVPPRRVPLFPLDPGDWAFPAPARRVGASLHSAQLLLVALEEGTEVASMGQPWLAGDDRAPVEPGELRRAAETWAERLAATIATPSPAGGEALPDAGPAVVAEGSAVWPARGTAWISGADALGAMHLFGGPAFAPPADMTTVLPLPASAWVRVTTTTTVDVVAAGTALEPADGWRGLQVFTDAALTRLEAVTAERHAARAEAISRRVADEAETRERVFSRLAEVVDERMTPLDTLQQVPAAMAVVARAAGIKLRAPERLPQAADDRLDAVARASGVRWRQVTLEGRWWRQAIGPLLGRMIIGDVGVDVALIPRRIGRMDVVDPEAGTSRRIDAALAEQISREAVVLYRPLPAGKISGADVLHFAARSARGDLVRLAVLAFAAGAISLVTPLVTKTIFSTVVPQREQGMLAWLVGLLVAFAVASFVFTVVQQLAIARASGAVTSEVQTAIWDRVLDLPLSFFRRYAAGALANRVMAIDRIQQLATTVIASSVLALPVGLFNLAFAFWLNARLALFGLAVLVVVAAGIALLTRTSSRHLATMTSATQESFGVAMQLLDGVGKLRIANAEDRAFAQWATRFASLKAAFVSAQRLFAAVTAFTASATAFGTLALFLGAATLSKGTLSGPTFIAFNTAFAQAMAATIGLTSIAIFLAQSRPLYESARPVLEARREASTVKADPGTLTGAVEVRHVTFRYAPDAPQVLNDLSFTVAPGEFVAVVGPSGAGKSSVMRILLGFEQPEVGTVRYDGKDLDSIDVRSVRRQIGVVTQSVRLLPGDIFTNIVGTRPLTMDDAWAAAEIAGIADDIRAMPMQMQTFVAEGVSTFSGGQAQRLLIARAVAAKPRILLFDEATSALDNRTQSQVADAIMGLRAARVVIAHRLSTIREADKILVLQDGRIVQSGPYDELVRVDGPFAKLARRQLV